MTSGGTPCARTKRVDGGGGGALSSNSFTPRCRNMSIVCLLCMSGPSVHAAALSFDNSSARSTAIFTPMQNPAVCATIIFIYILSRYRAAPRGNYFHKNG
jgi:hypothetical protein